MRYLGYIFLIVTACGGQSSGTKDQTANTPTTDSTPTPTPTPSPTQSSAPAVDWSKYTDCVMTQGVSPSAQNLQDKKALNSVAVGERLTTMLAEAKTALLNSATTNYYPGPVAECENFEVYRYHADDVDLLPTIRPVFEYFVLFCSGAVVYTKYCPSKGERGN